MLLATLLHSATVLGGYAGTDPNTQGQLVERGVSITHRLSFEGNKYVLDRLNLGPPQDIRVMIDTGAWSSFIYDQSCTHPDCVAINNLPNLLDSPAVQILTDVAGNSVQETLSFLSHGVQGFAATAEMTLRGTSVPNVPFLVAHSGGVPLPPNIHGLMGFGIPEGNDRPFWYRWATATGRATRFGLYLTADGGKLTLGNYDSDCKNGPMIWVPIAPITPNGLSQRWWAVPMLDFTSRSLTAPDTSPDGSLAIFDSGAEFSSGPRDLVEALYQNVYGIVCIILAGKCYFDATHAIDHDPHDVTFRFGAAGKVASVTLRYADLVGHDPMGCYGKIHVWEDNDNDNDNNDNWLLGHAFLRSVYTAYEAKVDLNGAVAAKMGFAAPKAC